jgi:hypothetical protein
MKGKTLLSFAIAIAMMLAIVPIIPIQASPTSMNVIFDATGTSTYNPGPPVCNNFTVTLKVFGVPKPPGAIQWMARLSWNPAVLELAADPNVDTSIIVEGNWLSSLGGTMFLFKNVSASYIGEMTDILMVAKTAGGDGELVHIKFHVKGIGSSNITIYDSAILDSGGNPIAHDIVNGYFNLPPPPATNPTADFTPANCHFVYVGAVIILNAGASTAGYDTLPPPGTSCPITSYAWDIFDGTTHIYKTGVIANFTCAGPGDVVITLTVTAPDPVPPSAPGYNPVATATHTIHQIIMPTGPNIDVYTDRGGLGPGLYPNGTAYPWPTSCWSDAYGPQELVTVYAKVTYNNESVEYKPVAFEIDDPTGAARDFRTAFTDANGIATTTFRVPWQGSNAESMFGNWSIWGGVDIAGTHVEDVCKFRFGYIISFKLNGIIVVPPTSVYKHDSLDVKADIQNISWNPQNAMLTITVYDECGVPIAVAYEEITVDAKDGLTNVYDLTIPQWAFVGTGHVYVNLFTNWPYWHGTPYCPEGTAIFTILKTPIP